MTGSSCEKFSDRDCKTPKVSEPPTPTPGNTITPAGSGPNFTNTPQSLQEVIQNIFNLALMVSGILAFGAVIYGAFMYTFSAGNPGMQSDARDQILQAFLGLALLLGSYLILNTINPNLTRITLNPLPVITAPENPYNPRALAGNCEILTSPHGDPNSLRPYFGTNAEMASRIVHQESNNDPSIESRTDVCRGGKDSFSIGLFQINIIAHGNALGCEAGIFEVRGGGVQGACLKNSPKGYCAERDCNVAAGKEAAYQNCKKIAKDPKKNIEQAVKLSSGGSNWGPWQYTYNLCRNTP